MGVKRIMPRTTFLIGNGIGMALDSTEFSLSTSIQNLWKLTASDPNSLSEEEKKRIIKLTKENSDENNQPPLLEGELLNLHRVVSSCKILSDFNSDSIRWLTEEASEFPKTIDYFIGKIAAYFHQTSKELPEQFVNNLVKSIEDNNGHLITLNYDNLLYSKFIDNKILNGYNGRLVDGFHRSGFKKEHLERKEGKNFGWYIHLHGSPLFYDKSNNILKLRSEDLSSSINDKSNIRHRHIVLTHFDMKSEIIAQSELLSVYWSFFQRALSESNRIYIFGYSGLDLHVNDALANWINSNSEIKIIIVEWKSDTYIVEERKGYWREKLRIREDREFTVHLMHNILEFSWD